MPVSTFISSPSQAQHDAIVRHLVDDRDLPQASRDRIDAFATELQRIHGFYAMNDPAPGYRLLVKMWRTGMVIKDNGEIKTANLMFIPNRDIFMDESSVEGQKEREAVLGETKYDPRSFRPALMNDTISNVPVRDRYNVALQDYDGMAFRRSLPDMMRDYNLLANAMLEPEDMSGDVFLKVEGSAVGADRAFTENADHFFRGIASEEIERWRHFIHDLKNQPAYIDRDAYDFMRGVNLANSHYYNWLIGSDLRGPDKNEIINNRREMAVNWPTIIPRVAETVNTQDPYYQSVINGEDIASLIAVDADVSESVVERMRGVSPSMLGKNTEISEREFATMLKGMESGTYVGGGVPQNAEDWEHVTAMDEFSKAIKPFLVYNQKENRSIEIDYSGYENVNVSDIRRAASLAPLVFNDVFNALIGTAVTHLHEKTGSLSSIRYGRNFSAFMTLASGMDFRGIVNVILDYHDNVMPKLHDVCLDRFTHNNADNIWPSMAGRMPHMVLSDGSHVNFYHGYSQMYRDEIRSGIPLTSFAYVPAVSTYQIATIQDSSGEFLCGMFIDPEKVKTIMAMDHDMKMADLDSKVFTDIPDFIDTLLTKDGVEPDARVREALWEFDSAIRSDVLKPWADFEMMDRERGLRLAAIREGRFFNYTPWQHTEKAFAAIMDIYHDGDMFPNREDFPSDDPNQFIQSINERGVQAVAMVENMENRRDRTPKPVNGEYRSGNVESRDNRTIVEDRSGSGTSRSRPFMTRSGMN